MNDAEKKWKKHQERTNARTEREVAKRVVQFTPLATDDIRAKLSAGTSPWERAALQRVLKARGEA